jgi:hypothetical protein
VPFPSTKVQHFYQAVEPYLVILVTDPKNANALEQVNLCNKAISNTNKQDGIPLTQWLIDIPWFTENFEKAAPYYERILQNPEDAQATEELTKISQEMASINRKRHYPDHWVVILPTAEDIAKYKAAKQAEDKTKAEAEAKAKAEAEAKAKAEAEAKAKADAAAASEWRPGLTESLEKILAMRPTEVRSRVTGELVPMKCKFVVHKKDQRNPIAFADSAELGERATNGYLKDLPPEQRTDIRCKVNSYSYKDQAGFEKILGVASEEDLNPRAFPEAVVWAQWKDGRQKVINRTGWRDIWGTNKADRKVEDFFLDNGLPIPWEKRAKRANTRTSRSGKDSDYQRSGRGFERSSRGRAREFERAGRRGERAFERSRSRRRSSSVASSASSVASYLASDPGLSRLERLESEFKDLQNSNREILEILRSQRGATV